MRLGSVSSLMLVGMLSVASGAADGLRVQDAWARASPPGVDKGAAYFRVTIPEGAPNDRLVGVVSPQRGKASLHATTSGAAGTRMEALAGVSVTAGETVAFAPGGRHVMITELDRPLQVGERLELMLRFERRGERVIKVRVRPLSASGPGGS